MDLKKESRKANHIETSKPATAEKTPAETLGALLDGSHKRLLAVVTEDASFVLAFDASLKPALVPPGMVHSTHAGADGTESYLRLTNGPADADSAGPTGGYSIRLPDEVEAAASGHRLTVSVVARASGNGESKFAVAYSTNEVGNSGWRSFKADADWAIYSFTYDVNPMKDGMGDFVGLLPDSEGRPGTEFRLLAIKERSLNNEESFPGFGSLWVQDHAGEHYLTVLRRLHEALRPQTYFEIGNDKGKSLALAQCATLAVDPSPRISVDAAIGTKPSFTLYRLTSDAFFCRHNPTSILGAPIDLAFLDGMHLCEYLLRDFINTERYSKRNSVIVLHDCLPVEWPMAERKHIHPALREHHKHSWTGDVWRTAILLKRRRPDLAVTAYAAPPSGLVCITNLSPKSEILADSYTDCVREMMSETLPEFRIDKLFLLLNVEPTSALADNEAISTRFWL